jgi:hypothetical protein
MGQLYCMVVTCLYVCIIYCTLFPVTVWWILHHPIQYIKNCWVRLLSNYNIKYICSIYTRLDTWLMSISRFSLREKNNTSTIEAIFLYSGCGRMIYGTGHKAKWLVLQCINGVSSNPVGEEQKFVNSKI